VSITIGIWIGVEVKSIAATVGQPDMRIDPFYNLAVELEHETQGRRDAAARN
jgi:hypothetical protein